MRDGRRWCAMRYLLMQGYHCPLLFQPACTACTVCTAHYVDCRVCLLCAHTVYNAGYVRSHPCPISLSATPILHHHYLRLMLQLDTVLSHNSCMKALPAAVTKLPKVSPDFSPIVLFRGRDIWSSGAPHVVGGEYIGGRGDPIIQIISPPRSSHESYLQQSSALIFGEQREGGRWEGKLSPPIEGGRR